METILYNQEGKTVGKYDLPESIFNVKANTDVVHEALKAQLSNARSVIANTKNRAQVRGGGRKPWRQKGTGRARHGSIRSPLWRGGGVSFGPTNERNFSVKINKKKKQKALFMVLSSKVREARFALLDDIVLDGIKTKTIFGIFNTLSQTVFGNTYLKKTLLIVPKSDKTIELSSRNIPNVKVISADSLNVGDILAYRYVLALKNTIPVMERTYVAAARKINPKS